MTPRSQEACRRQGVLAHELITPSFEKMLDEVRKEKKAYGASNVPDEQLATVKYEYAI